MCQEPTCEEPRIDVIMPPTFAIVEFKKRKIVLMAGELCISSQCHHGEPLSARWSTS